MPHADPDVRRAYMRAYRKANREKLREQKRRSQQQKQLLDPEWRARKSTYARKFASLEPRAVANARAAVHRAICRGQLVRPETCEQCGASGRIEAAHYSYREPLYVRWLCKPCHRAFDDVAPKFRGDFVEEDRELGPSVAERRSATHCKRGHEFNAANTRIGPTGGRSCRTCKREAMRRYRAEKRAREAECGSRSKGLVRR